jgi:hypothetical protein
MGQGADNLQGAARGNREGLTNACIIHASAGHGRGVAAQTAMDQLSRGIFLWARRNAGASNYTFAQARWTHGPRWKCCHPQAKDIACIIAAE